MSLHRRSNILTLRCLALMAPVFVASAIAGPPVQYFRHLPLNHQTPYLAYAGTDEISAEQAKSVEHYEFVTDAQSRVIEIRNYSSEGWHNHPLTHLGAFRTAITYDGAKETHRFYDKAGHRVRNLREVYEEVYSHDASGFRTGLAFFDLHGQPMQSNWGIARYAWEKQGDRIIERRYDLKGALAPMAPTFPFHISSFEFTADGHVDRHCNLNDRLEVADAPNGIACYRDVFAASGNLLGLTYYGRDGKVVNSPWKFAVVRLSYDKAGNVLVEDMLDKNGVLLRHTPFTYDATGKLTSAEK